MKNILKSIVLVVLLGVSQVSNAQVYFKMVVEDFYNFEFPRKMSASNALNQNAHTELQGTTGRCEYIINEYTKKMIVVLDNGIKNEYDILGYANGNKKAYLVVGPGFDGKVSRIMVSIVDSTDGEPYLLVESQVKDRPEVQRATMAKILN